MRICTLADFADMSLEDFVVECDERLGVVRVVVAELVAEGLLAYSPSAVFHYRNTGVFEPDVVPEDAGPSGPDTPKRRYHDHMDPASPFEGHRCYVALAEVGVGQ